jgi:hypothetical protein
MAIGEAGSITTNSPTENAPITVDLAEPLDNPVYALTATNNGGNQFSMRVVNETLDADGNVISFDFIIEEWEYHDGPHPATETINWMAVEEGTHTLPDGRTIEAGRTSADHTNSSVSLSGSYSDPPVVLTSVMSENDTTTVDSDPLDVTTSGFNVRLQEEEGQDGIHASETVGWIAIEPGGDATSGTAENHGGVDENTDVLGLGATFTDSVVIAETQTINGPDTATVVIDGQTNSSVGVFIEEEQSGDSETNHTNETVGVVAFDDGLIPCFTRGALIETPAGPRPVEALREGDHVTTPEGPRAVLRAFRRHLSAWELAEHPKLRPVCITAGALGAGLPQRDLVVSPQHRMLVNTPIARRMFETPEVLIAAVKLCALPGIYIDETVSSVEYVHLLLEQHSIVYAEGAPTESLLLAKGSLSMLRTEARAEVLTLFPELRQGVTPDPARSIPIPRRQKALARRIAKNRKLALIARDLDLWPVAQSMGSGQKLGVKQLPFGMGRSIVDRERRLVR